MDGVLGPSAKIEQYKVLYYLLQNIIFKLENKTNRFATSFALLFHIAINTVYFFIVLLYHMMVLHPVSNITYSIDEGPSCLLNCFDCFKFIPVPLSHDLLHQYFS